MRKRPTLLATDLEGVLVPEIWIAVAERTGIETLRMTTRDLPDYDQLMRQRLRILDEHQLSLADIQAVIATLKPLPGAADFLGWARSQMPCIIVSDTFYEFAMPLMEQLDYPTLWCHSLDIDPRGMLTGYTLRQPDAKRQSVQSLQKLGFDVFAVGDSYNDTPMLATAEAGILFGAPDNVAADYPEFPRLDDYSELRDAIKSFIERPFRG